MGDILDTIGPFTCTNGETLPLIGGSTGGNPWSHTAGSAGYTAISVRAGALIDQVTLGGSFGMAPFGGNGGEDKGTQQCPSGMVVVGLFGKATGTNPITIGLICRASTAGMCEVCQLGLW